jgi:flagellar hook protein FlgE
MNRALAIGVVVFMGCGGWTAPVTEEACALLGATAFRQGPIVDTGTVTDLALDGPGYFVLRDGDSTLFSRVGKLSLDREGWLVGSAGRRVKGFEDSSLQMVDLRVTSALTPPAPTTQIVLRGNLNASAPLKVFDPADPSSTSDHVSQLTVYDELGAPHAVGVYWTHTGAGSWGFHAMTDGANIIGGTAGEPSVVAQGALLFDVRGRLDSVTQSSSFLPNNSSSPQTVLFFLGDPISQGGTGLAGFTQFDSASATLYTAQDGLAAGALATLEFDHSGALLGHYSNGGTRVLGQVAVALFPAPQALRPLAGNLLAATLDSGEPLFGKPLEAGRAAIVPAALEVPTEDVCRR